MVTLEEAEAPRGVMVMPPAYGLTSGGGKSTITQCGKGYSTAETSYIKENIYIDN